MEYCERWRTRTHGELASSKQDVRHISRNNLALFVHSAVLMRQAECSVIEILNHPPMCFLLACFTLFSYPNHASGCIGRILANFPFFCGPSWLRLSTHCRDTSSESSCRVLEQRGVFFLGGKRRMEPSTSVRSRDTPYSVSAREELSSGSSCFFLLHVCSFFFETAEGVTECVSWLLAAILVVSAQTDNRILLHSSLAGLRCRCARVKGRCKRKSVLCPVS